MAEGKTKPKVTSSLAEQEMDRIEKRFQEYDKQIKDLTLDRMNAAPKQDEEKQTKLSQKDLEKSKEIYLKPSKTVPPKEAFNEGFRKQYEFAKEYVHFIAENKEIIGDAIELWTKPFAGMPAEFWKVPANTPVWGPRYLAERIKGCSYHRLKSENSTFSSDQNGQYYGSLVVDTTIQRLDAYPASQEKKSIFMGAEAA